MPYRRKPHSPAWFEALFLEDPETAGHAAWMVKRAKHVDICSACGGEPASDYELLSIELADGSVPTMRFCPSCAEVRHGIGEQWAPLDY